jgi:hypothetical protein
LFVGVRENFGGLGEGFLPFPPEIGELVARLYELLWADESLRFELFVGGGVLRVEELFDASDNTRHIKY